MKEFKKTMLRFFFTLELIVFTAVYFFGAQGIQHAWRLNKEIGLIDQEITELTQETKSINDRIVAWHSHSYYKEKIAREQLQMARPWEEIYYIT